MIQVKERTSGLVFITFKFKISYWKHFFKFQNCESIYSINLCWAGVVSLHNIGFLHWHKNQSYHSSVPIHTENRLKFFQTKCDISCIFPSCAPLSLFRKDEIHIWSQSFHLYCAYLSGSRIVIKDIKDHSSNFMNLRRHLFIINHNFRHYRPNQPNLLT